MNTYDPLKTFGKSMRVTGWATGVASIAAWLVKVWAGQDVPLEVQAAFAGILTGLSLGLVEWSRNVRKHKK